MSKEIVPVVIDDKIFVIRSKKVMLDSDLAELYQVPVKRLNEQVKRNLARFPSDFMFQLNDEEADCLRSQFATSNKKRGGRRYLPYAFTEHGVAMLSAILQSKRAIDMSIYIVWAFVKIRELLLTNEEIARKMSEVEFRQREHGDQIASLMSVVRQLIDPPKPKDKIGFSD